MTYEPLPFWLGFVVGTLWPTALFLVRFALFRAIDRLLDWYERRVMAQAIAREFGKPSPSEVRR